MTDEQLRLAHAAAEARNRQAVIPAPSPQPQAETHSTAIVTAHEGRPTVAEQKKNDWRVFP